MCRNRVRAIHKWEKIANGHPGHAVDPLGQALELMHSFLAEARAASAASVSFKVTFRLDNPFVCGFEDVRQAYRQALMKTFTKIDGDAWVAIARSVSNSVQSLIHSGKALDGSTVLRANVMEMSRRASLAAVLKALFDIDHVPENMLAYLGFEINRLSVWKKHLDAGSSSSDAVPEAFLQSMDRLISCLRGLFSEAKETNDLARLILCSVSGSPEAFNPLNLVIPAFEGPWRTIFYTLLAVLQQGPAGIDDLLSLRDLPAWQRPPPRVKGVVFESLRLYPPIRRMRMSKKANIRGAFGMGRIIDIDQKIDAEAILRNSKYWGPTAAEWGLSRFLRMDGGLDSSVLSPSTGWIPFAAGGMKCPSAGGFSVRLTAVIVGELLRQIFPRHDQPQWYLDGPEWDSSSEAGQILRSGRDEYSSVDVVVGSDRPQTGK